ncbi:hypothetical protein D9757_010407 [Collybiopsis confluens]|uniref:ABC1 atypical kinase-like domain-containing protein n=1 Tax=Collybiopsis confluens TaxID=2823264 RepID=A0A8H5LL81_9AGAR|nr:hypothetical protein D9757_013222 [Collybiopsis confluens]KAF5368731.1 hypothetical protein D9757_010407 [Collybiopsis confluens]
MTSFRNFISVLLVINASSLVFTICGAVPTSRPTRKATLLKKFDRPWILGAQGDSEFSASDQQVFSKALTGVSVGPPMVEGVASGSCNEGIASLKADYKGHKASEVVAKALTSPVDADTNAEVKALNTLTDLYIDSGMLTGWPCAEPSPVILMKKVPGRPMKEYPAYSHFDKHQLDAIHTTLQKMVCSQVVKWALEHRLLFADLHQGNIMVVMEGTTVKSMQIIDFGFPGVFTVAASVKEQDVHTWCMARFAETWNMP